MSSVVCIVSIWFARSVVAAQMNQMKIEETKNHLIKTKYNAVDSFLLVQNAFH